MKLLLAVLTVGVVAALSAGVASASDYYPSYSSTYHPSSYSPSSYSPSYYSPSYYTPTYGLYSGSYYRPSYYTPSYRYTPSYYGQLNAAGYPKNQYVHGYLRSNGTYVQGYWRNSPTDSYPTCRVISC